MGRKILVADDTISFRKELQNFLTGQGFEVLAVGNGDLAFQRVRDMLPELALLDIIMPGKSGYEVCTYIKKTLGLQIPVVLLRHDYEPFDEREAVMAEADSTLVKPLDPTGLLDLIVDLWTRYGFLDAEPVGSDASWADVADEMEAIVENGDAAEFAGNRNPEGFLSFESGREPDPAPENEPAAAEPIDPATWLSDPAVNVEPVEPETMPEAAAAVAAAWDTRNDWPPAPEASGVTGGPVAPAESRAESLDDPYAIVMRGEYEAFFNESAAAPEPAYSATNAPPVDDFIAEYIQQATDPLPDVSPDAPSATDVSLSPEEIEHSIRSYLDQPTAEAVHEVIGGAAADPYPNPFAPLPPQPAPEREFVVPSHPTLEIPGDPAAGARVSFDSLAGTVRIHGLIQEDGTSLSMEEVEIPYVTGEHEPVAENPESENPESEEGGPGGLDFDEVDDSTLPDGREPSLEDKVEDDLTAELDALLSYDDDESQPPDAETERSSDPLALDDVAPPPVVAHVETDPLAGSLFTIPPETRVRVCRECGSPAAEGDIFCRVCDATIEETGGFDPLVIQERVRAVEARTVCRHCGASVTEGDVFCLKCGEVI